MVIPRVWNARAGQEGLQQGTDLPGRGLLARPHAPRSCPALGTQAVVLHVCAVSVCASDLGGPFSHGQAGPPPALAERLCLLLEYLRQGVILTPEVSS